MNWGKRLQHKFQDVVSSLGKTVDAALSQDTFFKGVKVLLTGMGYVIEHFFGGIPVLFLGPVGGGKTSLTRYLVEGRPPRDIVPTLPGPPEEIERKREIGERRGADRTVIHLPHDVSGESREFWRRILVSVDPCGLIILIDGASSYETFRNEYREALDDIAPVYARGGRNLRVVYTFLNKCDQWQQQNARKLRLTAIVNDEIARVIDGCPALAKVQWGTAETQLNPDATAWPEVDHALNHFRTDLKAGLV
jgi:hypothetical protein